jgi:hypothetical protein
MNWDIVFQTANQIALPCWLALILLPRHRFLIWSIRYGAVGVLALLYSALMFTSFFEVTGGGFGSIAEVRALFASDPVLVAGWVHYLAFDLLVGLGIAASADRHGLSRIVQAPMLLATFLFGPLGLVLLRLVVLFVNRRPALEGATI